MRTVILIPARSGSERVINKNFREIGGESLLSRAARIGVSSGLDTFVSTDTPSQAAEHVPSTVQIVERPAHLATSDAPIENTLMHFADELKLQPQDRILLLQATSPLRTSQSLTAFLAACNELDLEYASAFSATADYGDYWFVSRESGARRIRDLLPSTYAARSSQHRDPFLRENGLYYLCSVDYLKRTHGLIGPSSLIVISPADEDLDVDDQVDWHRAEVLLERGIR
jgi:pseudaminic acid cytidylyltransferase